MKAFRQPHRPKKSQLVISAKEVIKAMNEGLALDRIYIDTKLDEGTAKEVKRTALQHQVPVNYVPVAKLNSFNTDGHGGVIAMKAKVQYQNLQDVISFVVEKGEAPLLLILDGITDIRNIGGIARTALCCGVHAIVIPEKGVGALNEDAVLTSAGALEQIAVCRVNSLMKTVDDLHMNGIKVLASEMKGDKLIADVDFTEPCAIVLGGEEKGIYPALLKICDEQIKIPMKNNFESLNVSVATGMILYEAMKQRL